MRLRHVGNLALGLFLSSQASQASQAHAGRCPNVGIVLDRSSSMLAAPDGSAAGPDKPSKWTIATQAIAGVVNRHDGRFPIGLVYFPSTSQSGLCAVSPSFDFPIGYGQKGGLLGSLSGVQPNGNTPTGNAIMNAINDPAFLDASRKQYLILLTDGKPCCQAGCMDSVQAAFDAVSAVQTARGRLQEIKTIVIGFGQLQADEQQVMNELADAGGMPAAKTGPTRYYRADDSTALNTALDNIVKTLIAGGGDVGPGVEVCDDSCYAVGCPSGEICVAAACQKNPCASVSCEAGTYCYTDGHSPGQCVKPCRASCAAGQRCIRGECQTAACKQPCESGQRCGSGGQCEADPACFPVQCRNGQGCVGGACVDDPCRYVSCPNHFSCVPLEGTCVPTPGSPDDSGTAGGCSCDVSGGRGSLSFGAALLLLLGLRLTRKRSVSQNQPQTQRPSIG